MSGSRLARRQSRNHARYRGRNDVNIVPMLDIFTILLFFLIFTAVFSKTHIVDLDLPAKSSEPLKLPDGLSLEVVVHRDGIVVQDKNSGPLQTLPNTASGYDFAGVTDYLSRVKSQFPDMKSATLLLDPDIPYETIIATMDAMRSYEGVIDGKPARGELFPQVSLGDAPAAEPAT
jgi:biopolymer transport protein ExbD